MPTSLRNLANIALFAFLTATAGCDLKAEEDAMPLACRAQSYRYSQYTGGSRSCHCHDTEFATDAEDPQAVCQGLYDELFNASYSSGSHSREFSFITPGPGLTCEEIDIEPCDNTEI